VKNIGESAFFKKINKDKVFNLDEAGLFCQKRPMCTFMSKIVELTQGLKSVRIISPISCIVMLQGDCKVKPALICCSVTPQTIKGKNKNH